ncbi:MAG: hypothetical protein J9259_09150 [Thermoplasmata archaeon YP2-bin.285]|uniref:Uncharacterized protein n=1 Tax=Candidatus Sysuiplasma superficiale TaxID=2823368 RepID=A0A8J7YPT8_9ARCH|nr:hypothetical protein [Candidatus Sysuiplasma superficiale]
MQGRKFREQYVSCSYGLMLVALFYSEIAYYEVTEELKRKETLMYHFQHTEVPSAGISLSAIFVRKNRKTF